MNIMSLSLLKELHIKQLHIEQGIIPDTAALLPLVLLLDTISYLSIVSRQQKPYKLIAVCRAFVNSISFVISHHFY